MRVNTEGSIDCYNVRVRHPTYLATFDPAQPVARDAHLVSKLLLCEAKAFPLFFDTATHVVTAHPPREHQVSFAAEPGPADQIDQLAKALLIERRASLILGQYTLERRILALDLDHCIIDQPADFWLFGIGL